MGNKSIINNKILDFNRPMDYTYMIECLNELCSRYGNINMISIGTSILGKSIPMICMGQGQMKIIYVGAIHGTDSLCTSLLLRFINEYCEIYRSGHKIFNLNTKHVEESRTICIIPMLNPDGVDYAINGIDRSNPFYDRLMKKNNSNDDFSHWPFNARGVDLDENFSHSGQQESLSIPESEPESSALSGIIKFNKNNIKLLVQFRCGEERLIYAPSQGTTLSTKLARVLGRVYRAPFCTQSSDLHTGSLIKFASQIQGIPAYTLLCPQQRNNQKGLFQAYAELRETLFLAPTFV